MWYLRERIGSLSILSCSTRLRADRGAKSSYGLTAADKKGGDAGIILRSPGGSHTKAV